MPTLTHKVALVTGGARGIGRAVAVHLAELGAAVAVLDRDDGTSQQVGSEGGGSEGVAPIPGTCAAIAELGGSAMLCRADVTDQAAVEQAVDQVVHTWGRLDVLVCNAGGGEGRPEDSRASQVDMAQFRRVLDRNLYGTVHSCLAAAPVMKEQRSGRIVTVSSKAGRRPHKYGMYSHYGSAKAAVEMYSRYLAQDLAEYGITVNCIAPGSIGTERLMPMFEAADLNRVVGRIPVGRLGTPADCAYLVGVLASDAAGDLTGAVIPIDGGGL